MENPIDARSCFVSIETSQRDLIKASIEVIHENIKFTICIEEAFDPFSDLSIFGYSSPKIGTPLHSDPFPDPTPDPQPPPPPPHNLPSSPRASGSNECTSNTNDCSSSASKTHLPISEKIGQATHKSLTFMKKSYRDACMQNLLTNPPHPDMHHETHVFQAVSRPHFDVSIPNLLNADNSVSVSPSLINTIDQPFINPSPPSIPPLSEDMLPTNSCPKHLTSCLNQSSRNPSPSPNQSPEPPFSNPPPIPFPSIPDGAVLSFPPITFGSNGKITLTSQKITDSTVVVNHPKIARSLRKKSLRSFGNCPFHIPSNLTRKKHKTPTPSASQSSDSAPESRREESISDDHIRANNTRFRKIAERIWQVGKEIGIQVNNEEEEILQNLSKLCAESEQRQL